MPAMLPCCRAAVLPKPPRAFWTPNWHHGRGSDAALSCKYLKCFGGPGEIRTHDLFHAMVVGSITYEQFHQKQKTCATKIWTPFGRCDRFHDFWTPHRLQFFP